MTKILIDETAVQMVLEALELAQDNLRDHGDNCYLHDEGEYNRCFCGKDSLSDHPQSVVEKLESALAEQPAQPQQGPKLPEFYAELEYDNPGWDVVVVVYQRREDATPLLVHREALPNQQPAQRKSLTAEQVRARAESHGMDGDALNWYVAGFVDAQEAHNIKENT